MPGAVPNTTAGSTSVLPSAEFREQVGQRLTELAQAIEAHPQIQAPNSKQTLFHLWDFVKRTQYYVSELDNIAAGRPIQHPAQIPQYRAGSNPQPEKAKECMADVLTRSVTVKMMVSNPTTMLPLMGLVPVEFGSEIKAKANELVEFLKTD